MLRLSLLWLFIAFFAAYAWRDWYKSLCALILLMAFVEHPDFPKSMLDMQGLNPWNILLLVVALAWAASRRIEGLQFDLPRNMLWLLVVYFVVIVIAYLRVSENIGTLAEFEVMRGRLAPTKFGLFSEYIVNCLKWVVPGLLLFDGCNSKSRFRLAFTCVLAIYVLLAIQVIRWMPLSAISGGEDLSERALKILSNEVGYHRVNLSMLLGGASWAIFCAMKFSETNRHTFLAVGCIGLVMLAQALTGGRMGYAAWFALAIVFGILKWRAILVAAPVAALLLVLAVPAIQERVMQGFSPDSVDSSRIEHYQYGNEDGPDIYTVTAGRTFAWQFVAEEIKQSPFLGHGRNAMITTGIAPFLLSEYNESFPHPHNAYLEWLLDNGIVGVFPVFLFYFLVIRYCRILFRVSDSKICLTIGGATLALVVAFCAAGIGSQTFYPREGAVGMWCCIGLMLRIYVQYGRWKVSDQQDDAIDTSSAFWIRSPSHKLPANHE